MGLHCVGNVGYYVGFLIPFKRGRYKLSVKRRMTQLKGGNVEKLTNCYQRIVSPFAFPPAVDFLLHSSRASHKRLRVFQLLN